MPYTPVMSKDSDLNWDELFRDCHETLFRIVSGKLPEGITEKAVEIAYRRVLIQFERCFEFDPSQVCEFLFTAAKVSSLDFMNREKTARLTGKYLGRCEDFFPDGEISDIYEAREIIQDRILSLPWETQAALVYYHRYGFSKKELAVIFGSFCLSERQPVDKQQEDAGSLQTRMYEVAFQDVLAGIEKRQREEIAEWFQEAAAAKRAKPSLEHRQAMREIEETCRNRGKERPKPKVVTARRFSRIAAMIAISVVVFSFTVTYADAVWKSIRKMFFQDRGIYTEFELGSQSTEEYLLDIAGDKIPGIYIPYYIPSGFLLIETDVDDDRFKMEYQRDNDYITIKQACVADTVYSGNYDTEDALMRSVEINHMSEATLRVKENNIFLFMYNERFIVEIHADGVSEDQVIKLANSMGYYPTS